MWASWIVGVFVLLIAAVAIIAGCVGWVFSNTLLRMKAKKKGVPIHCICLQKKMELCDMRKMCLKVCDCPDGASGPCDGKGWCNT